MFFPLRTEQRGKLPPHGKRSLGRRITSADEGMRRRIVGVLELELKVKSSRWRPSLQSANCEIPLQPSVAFESLAAGIQRIKLMAGKR